MLKQISQQAILADQLGYNSISFTEHDFQIEGTELSNNPAMLDLYIAMQMKRIRVGWRDIVLPAENPITEYVGQVGLMQSTVVAPISVSGHRLLLPVPVVAAVGDLYTSSQ
jgi:hypothetical protein